MKVASIEAIARALNDAGVPFIVVGGLAVNAYGYGRLTWDLDLVIRLERDPVRNAFGALATLGYRPRVPVTAEGFRDIFVTEPFDFDEAYRQALIEELAPGVPVRIVRLATLVQMKRAADRAQDKADIQELRLLHGDSADG